MISDMLGKNLYTNFIEQRLRREISAWEPM